MGVICTSSILTAVRHHEIWSVKNAKPTRRGNAWRIEVRFKGKRYAATRDTASENANSGQQPNY